MKADSSQVTNRPRRPIPLRMMIVAAASIAAFFASGCTGPTTGPTNPKAFIGQGREWTTNGQTSGAPSTTPAPSAPSGDAASLPPPNG